MFVNYSYDFTALSIYDRSFYEFLMSSHYFSAQSFLTIKSKSDVLESSKKKNAKYSLTCCSSQRARSFDPAAPDPRSRWSCPSTIAITNQRWQAFIIFWIHLFGFKITLLRNCSWLGKIFTITGTHHDQVVILELELIQCLDRRLPPRFDVELALVGQLDAQNEIVHGWRVCGHYLLRYFLQGGEIIWRVFLAQTRALLFRERLTMALVSSGRSLCQNYSLSKHYGWSNPIFGPTLMRVLRKF